MNESLFNIKNIYEHLQDSKSRELFQIRSDYFMDRDLSVLRDRLTDAADTFYDPDFESYMETFEAGQPVCIWGCGLDGERTFKILNKFNRQYNIAAFCDSNPMLWGKTFQGKPVLTPAELRDARDRYVVLIATGKYVSSIYETLLSYDFPRNSIFYPRHRCLVALTGKQYFDLPAMSHDPHEIFVDAGSYDGSTSLDFAVWCGGDYDKIYAFEPSPESAAVCRQKFEQNHIKNAAVIEAGTWDKSDTLLFDSGNGSGSSFCKGGNIAIPVTSIDETVGDDIVTFIKMDVEGSELETLRGARNTIMTHHPKLAVSLYHKPWDIITLPHYILSLNPDYRFYIRHYASNDWETVLYAI